MSRTHILLFLLLLRLLAWITAITMAQLARTLLDTILSHPTKVKVDFVHVALVYVHLVASNKMLKSCLVHELNVHNLILLYTCTFIYLMGGA